MKATIKLDMEQYAALARQVAADGCVLLKNEREALPLRKGDQIAVFGRSAFHYYKSGLGSGGLVNTRYTVGILDALRAEESISINEKVLDIYREWLKENPYDAGKGWGRIPWSQKEMPITENLLRAAEGVDAAIVIIGRTAGEDQDNVEEPGSYLLNSEEKELIRRVSARFSRTIVLLNVGNIIDMKWAEECSPAAMMYVWQGGQEGGNGVCDVLLGRVNPSGCLADTIAYNVSDYPSSPNFGDENKNYYSEDIYVGYRYFETFAKDKVMYPFGFGLSYTTFGIQGQLVKADQDSLQIKVSVTNTGKTAGRKTVQLYLLAPQGRLGKPDRVLISFQKTKLLSAGEMQEILFEVSTCTFASYDDSGITGHKSCYVLEAGEYRVFAGADVRSAGQIGSFEVKELKVVEQLEEACAPLEAFERMKAETDKNGNHVPGKELVPIRTADWHSRRAANLPREIPYTGNKGIKLADVYENKVEMEDFLAQLSDEELICLFRGEGMCSPKVTPGTGAAFGGLTEGLTAYGIPAACCTDGPSGIRMDVGTKAFSLPSGAVLASSFDPELIEELFQMTGRELRLNRIDALLGPGMNIHRHPLNGRNFEYFSEDPCLTGKIAAAQIKGLEISGCTGVIKHFCANNQEKDRRKAESVISERALREIYLKGFEIAVKEGNARAVMTTYGPVNGIWTSCSYDLNTTILRGEWGFDGLVMSDWWAAGSREGETCSSTCHAAMAEAQNDIYMVCSDCTDMEQDDMLAALCAKDLKRGELQRNAGNILRFLLKSPAMLYEMNLISEEEKEFSHIYHQDDEKADEIIYLKTDEDGNAEIDVSACQLGQGDSVMFGIEFTKMGVFEIEIRMNSETGELAQLPVTVSLDSTDTFTMSFRGTDGQSVTQRRVLGMILGNHHYLKFFVGADGIHFEKICLNLKEEFTPQMMQ